MSDMASSSAALNDVRTPRALLTNLPAYDASQLEILCWCGRAVVYVPKSWVREGRTRNCGRNQCYPGCAVSERADVFDDPRTEYKRARKRRRGAMMDFDIATYKPAQDSSAAYRDNPRYANEVVLRVHPGMCKCGCGGQVQAKTSRFVQGHDVRLRGVLIRAVATQTPVRVVTGTDEIVYQSALEYAEQLSTPQMDWAVKVMASAVRYMDSAVL